MTTMTATAAALTAHSDQIKASQQAARNAAKPKPAAKVAQMPGTKPAAVDKWDDMEIRFTDKPKPGTEPARSAVKPVKPKASPMSPVVSKPKASKPKPAAKVAKVQVPVERVPAAEVVALLKELGITATQLAQVVGKSPSLMSEWVGKGRGHLVSRDQWALAVAAAQKFVSKAAVK